MIPKIHEIIAWVVVSQTLLLFLFVAFNAVWQKKARLIFAVTLFSILCIYCNCLVGFNFKEVYDHFPIAVFLFTPFWYLIAPSIYLLIKSQLNSKFRFGYSDLIHLIPFLTVVLYLIFNYYLLTQDVKREIVDNAGMHSFLGTMNLISHFIILTYIILSVKVLLKSRSVNELPARFPSRVHFNWLVLIISGYTLVWISWAVNTTIFHFTGKGEELISLGGKIAILFYTSAIVWQGLKNPRLMVYQDYISRMHLLSFSNREAGEEYARIQEYIQNRKPYLNPELSLESLAAELSLSPKQLSFLINSSALKNFNEYINSFRIEEAKRLLSDTTSRLTVLEVLYQVGFNSKSAFNTAFKKATDLTPTEYRTRYA